MLEVERPADMAAHVGKPIGTSEWFTVDQSRIDQFAEATGDHQWIHVDVERARREMPGGKTIAHGYLTLSLLPVLSHAIYRIRNRSRALNYGSNRVRFTAPVPAGSRVRLSQALKAVEPIEGGVRLIMECTVEVEGKDKPALVAETVSLVYD
ncbi:MAG: MaoC family dehydratase [Acidisphaera sp.]|nr:MaoC family dehydratase [Acidisphaera sp.]